MSIVKHKNQRVAMFIDTQNLYHSARNLYNGRVNFKNVLDEAVAGRQLIRALAYVISTEEKEEANFFEALTKIGIETKTKDLRIFANGNKKGDWDVGLTVDAIRLANKVDSIILATGDEDYMDLVEYLKFHFGVQVEVITFGKSCSTNLRNNVDDFIDMGENLSKFLIRNNFKHKKINNFKKVK